MKYSLFVVIMVLMSLFQSQAQNNAKPRWVSKPPFADNSTYFYQVAKGTGSSRDKAKEMMFNDVKKNIAEYFGVPTHYVASSSSQLRTTGQVVVKSNTSINGKSEFTIPMKRVCLFEDESSGLFVCYGLFQVASAGNIQVQFTHFNQCGKMDKTGSKAFARSLILPGWGQMYKGEKKKGTFVLCSEAILLGTGLTSQYMYTRYYNKASSSTSASEIETYTNNRDTWGTIRTVSLIGAGAVYIYNLIDAASGVKKYAFFQKAELTPMYAQNSVQFKMSYRF